jgi:hypothetical protein
MINDTFTPGNKLQPLTEISIANCLLDHSPSAVMNPQVRQMTMKLRTGLHEQLTNHQTTTIRIIYELSSGVVKVEDKI